MMILIVLLCVFILSAKSYHNHYSCQLYQLRQSYKSLRSMSMIMKGRSSSTRYNRRNKSTALRSRWSSINSSSSDRCSSSKKKSPSTPQSPPTPSAPQSPPLTPLSLDGVKNVLRNLFSDDARFTKIDARFNKVENDTVDLKKNITDLKKDFKLGLALVLFLGGAFFVNMAAVREEMKADMAAVREEMKADKAEMREERRADKAEMREERKADKAEMREERRADKAEMEQKYDITTAVSVLALIIPIVTRSGSKTMNKDNDDKN